MALVNSAYATASAQQNRPAITKTSQRLAPGYVRVTRPKVNAPTITGFIARTLYIHESVGEKSRTRPEERRWNPPPAALETVPPADGACGPVEVAMAGLLLHSVIDMLGQ